MTIFLLEPSSIRTAGKPGRLSHPYLAEFSVATTSASIRGVYLFRLDNGTYDLLLPRFRDAETGRQARISTEARDRLLRQAVALYLRLTACSLRRRGAGRSGPVLVSRPRLTDPTGSGRPRHRR